MNKLILWKRYFGPFFATLLILTVITCTILADMVTFDSLGIGGTYNSDANEFQASFDLQVPKSSDLSINLYTFRDTPTNNCEVYVDEVLASSSGYINSGNQEKLIKVPSVFINEGINEVTLKCKDNDKFSSYPISFAPGSYVELVSPSISVPQNAITFDSLAIPGTYNVDANEFQISFDLQVPKSSDLSINLYTFRDTPTNNCEIYVDEVLASSSGYINSGNQEKLIKVPSVFINEGINEVTLKCKDNDKFSSYPIGLAPGSYIVSSTLLEPVQPTPTPAPTTYTSPTPTPTPTQTPTPYHTPTTSPAIPTPLVPTLTPAASPDEVMPPCEKGYKDCYLPWGDCETNIYEDNDNCGDCGNQCPEGYFCLLGSCVEDTTANKEKLAAYYMEQYQRYDEEKRYEDAKNYLLKAKDVYIDINRPGQVLEIDGLIEEIEEKIFERDIFELVFEIAIAVILAVFFGFIFARKTKKVSLWIVVTSSAMVFFIVFLVLRLWILSIFY